MHKTAVKTSCSVHLYAEGKNGLHCLLLCSKKRHSNGEVGVVKKAPPLALTDNDTERTINTHDLSIPIPPSKAGEQQFFRVLLLSSSDMESPTNASARVERLDHQTGGRNVGIIFLLRERGEGGHGMEEYMKLQLRYVSYRWCIEKTLTEIQPDGHF